MRNGSQLIKYMSIVIIVISICVCQLENPTKIHIQSRKFSAISGQQAQTKVTPTPTNYTVPYAKPFTRKPDVGLSVYNIQFDYNPQFSMNVIQDTSTVSNFQFYVTGRPSQTNIYNQLFIMYIASDYDQFGIYMPGPRNTTARLGIPTEIADRSQQFTFNFKNIKNQPIFPSNTNPSNIKVTVYLTGIQAFSQTTNNGFLKNYTYFSLAVSTVTPRFYTILVSVRSSSGDVLIKIIEFTVVYFDVTKIADEYQMNSNSVLATNFGGTFFKSSSNSMFLEPLAQLPDYQNTLQYFFGISQIECSEGQTINLLAVQQFNYNNNGKLQNIVLQLQTQRNTYIRRGVYNYIQYKPRTCNDSASCGIPCGDPNQPSYRITNLQNRCAPCLYFCLTCQNGFNCTSCPQTRTLGANSLCICANKTIYDDQVSRQCQQCFDTNFCQTCSRKGVCQTCFDNYNFTYNNVLRTCQCSAGTYNSVAPVKNGSALLARVQIICKACPSNCIYCTNFTSCESCQVKTYLALSPKSINDQIVTCSFICNNSEQYDQLTRKCRPYNGDLQLFDQAGRLGFDWTYKNQNNQLVADLLFSQRNMTYYFYENGKGYQYIRTTTEQTQRDDAGQSAFYYDDGNGYIGGYSGTGSTAFQSSIVNTKTTQQTGGYNFDQSALKGQYYGLGQAKFYSQQYRKYQPQAEYFDQFNIPFGKHQLKTTQIADSATFLDALRNNLQFVVDGESMPYTIRALSGNQFQLIVRPQKSYLKSNASIVFKNPALVRAGETALQTPIVTKQIDRLDYYTQNQLATAINLKNRTSTIVQILWGICKYILFTGFGWSVMPLMLILQYIFGHNYITSQLPLNLDYFLTAFADFRNPSILFNPQRNQFDRQVVNHDEIYKRVSAYQQFDRGIDFMKNSFQFFFTPLLSFGLLFLFLILNKVVNLICKRDISLISKYLQPRAGLHAAAYTLVQALPISFFFFGQLQDTRYSHKKAPNSIYPSFNTGMSFASFFASAIIPLVLLTGIYNYFKNKARSGTFQLNKAKGDENIDTVSKDPAMIGDPLWGGNPYKPLSYGFGASVFYLPLLVGFFLSFFTKSYPWQLTGLLLGHAGLGSFAAASHHFDHKIPKFFFAGISALMVGYELVHAGVGSNRALSTYDQWNTGYLGIGLIYAMLLAGIIFSGYLVYKLLTHLYRNIIKPFGCFPKLGQKLANLKTLQDEEVNLRDKVLGKDQRRKSTIAQSRINYLHSQQRLLNREHTLNDIKQNNNLFSQPLLLQGTRNDGKSTFRAKQSNQFFTFPYWSSQILRKNEPLTINSQNKIFNNGRLIGTVARLMDEKQPSESSDDVMIGGGRNKPSNTNTEMTNMSNRKMMINSNNDLNQAYEMVKNNRNSERSFNLINVNGQQLAYDEDDDGNFYISNYNGKSRSKLSEKQFFATFSQNRNKINYQNKQYFIESSEESNYYYLVDPLTMQRALKLSKQSLHNLFSQNKKILSTSMQQSNKFISNPNYVVENDQYALYHPGPSNKSIVYTKESQQYLINGKIYEKVGENDQLVFFNNIDTGQKLSMKKSQARIRASKTQQTIGSLKYMVQTTLKQKPDSFIFEGQKYVYKGVNNNKYSFMNTNTNILRYFTLQQIAKFLGFRPDIASHSSIDKVEMGQRRVLQSNNSIQQQNDVYFSGKIPLKLVQTDKQNGVYIYQNIKDQQRYEIPFEWIDVNEMVYIDKNKRIWHKNQMLEIDSEEEEQQQSRHEHVMVNKQYNKNNINNKQSDTQISLTNDINPNHTYNIKFLSPDYEYSDTRPPSGKDIQQVRQNIWGANVSALVNQMRKINPYAKVYIQSLVNPSEKLIIQ